ncbi:MULTISPECIES: alpha/beta fold hydrolase [unclassified Blastococcus]
MSTFALVHGAGDDGWYWHLVESDLRRRGHHAVAPDLPAGDDSLTLDDYADAVVEAVGAAPDLVVVGHSFGGFTAPLVAARLRARALVLVAAMVPAPGEAPDEWWISSGYAEAARAQAARDGGRTGSDDPYVAYYHDVPRSLAEEAISRERAHPSTAACAQPWPLEAWPDVPTTVVVCTQDRLFPAGFLRRLAAVRLGVRPVEIDAGHCVALSRPGPLADVLAGAG